MGPLPPATSTQDALPPRLSSSSQLSPSLGPGPGVSSSRKLSKLSSEPPVSLAGPPGPPTPVSHSKWPRELKGLTGRETYKTHGLRGYRPPSAEPGSTARTVTIARAWRGHQERPGKANRCGVGRGCPPQAQLTSQLTVMEQEPVRCWSITGCPEGWYKGPGAWGAARRACLVGKSAEGGWGCPEY